MNKNFSRRSDRRLIVSALLLVLAMLASVAPTFAGEKKQGKVDLKKDYALIFGTVWTPDDHPAYGVTVKIRRADEKKARWELTSDHNGEFAQRVPPGAADYIVWAEVPNKKGPVAETKVHIDNDERADIGLHLTE